MRSTLILYLSLFIFSASLAFAEEEKITITTYYPSPYGVYKELRIYPTPQTQRPDCNNDNRGTLFYDDTEKTMQVCAHTPGGNTLEWLPLAGQEAPGQLFEQSPTGGKDVIFNNTGKTTINNFVTNSITLGGQTRTSWPQMNIRYFDVADGGTVCCGSGETLISYMAFQTSFIQVNNGIQMRSYNGRCGVLQEGWYANTQFRLRGWLTCYK